MNVSARDWKWLLLDWLGINAIFHFINRRRARIICYHGICADDFDLLRGYDERHLSVSAFRAQVEHLRKVGFVFVTLGELVDRLSAGKSIGGLVCLSFDDGFRSVVTRAYPLMRELGARGSFFPATVMIDKSDLLWTDLVETVVRSAPDGEFHFHFAREEIVYHLRDEQARRQAMRDIKDHLRSLSDRERREHMRQFAAGHGETAPDEFRFASWDQLRGLDPQVLELGSHTRSHPNCTALSNEAEFEEEYSRSRLDIEERCGHRVRFFAYPAGDYDERVAAELKARGYEAALTSDHGFVGADADPLSLPRVPTEESLPLFKALVSGAYFFIERINRRIGRL